MTLRFCRDRAAWLADVESSETIFGAPGQILTIRRDTLDPQAYMPGAPLGIRRIRERKGLVDCLEHLLELS